MNLAAALVSPAKWNATFLRSTKSILLYKIHILIICWSLCPLAVSRTRSATHKRIHSYIFFAANIYYIYKFFVWRDSHMRNSPVLKRNNILKKQNAHYREKKLCTNIGKAKKNQMNALFTRESFSGVFFFLSRRSMQCVARAFRFIREIWMRFGIGHCGSGRRCVPVKLSLWFYFIYSQFYYLLNEWLLGAIQPHLFNSTFSMRSKFSQCIFRIFRLVACIGDSKFAVQ